MTYYVRAVANRALVTHQACASARVYHLVGEVVDRKQVPKPAQALAAQTAQARPTDAVAGANTIYGPLNLQQRQHDDSWIIFHDTDGIEQGQLMRGRKGLTLQTRSGDFAEWHPRARAYNSDRSGTLALRRPHAWANDSLPVGIQRGKRHLKRAM